jgi:hypothetical protein
MQIGKRGRYGKGIQRERRKRGDEVRNINV